MFNKNDGFNGWCYITKKLYYYMFIIRNTKDDGCGFSYSEYNQAITHTVLDAYSEVQILCHHLDVVEGQDSLMSYNPSHLFGGHPLSCSLRDI